MRIEISSDAELDIENGYWFYEYQEPGVGDYFLSTIFAEIESLVVHGGSHVKVDGYYRKVCRTFPYNLYYDKLEDVPCRGCDRAARRSFAEAKERSATVMRRSQIFCCLGPVFHFLGVNMRLFVLALLLPCLANKILAQDKPDPIGRLDPGMAERAKAADGLLWFDVTLGDVEGRILPDQSRERWFDRFPASAQKTVTSNVWNLSRHSAGMMVRFETDSSEIHVDYELLSRNLAMPHMPATGVSGMDLYARDVEGNWRWVQVTRPTTTKVKTKVVSGLAPGLREYAAYLPLYNGVLSLSIGVKPGSKFKQFVPRAKPIVFYGTSITHGACASRPGMVHTAILGRRFDMPVVNLGFSGNGKMDTAVGDFLTQLDAAAFVIDCLPNMNAEMVRKKCVPLVRLMRERKPDTPIILVEDRRNTNSWILPARDKHHDSNHAALREAFETLVAAEVQGLYYIEGETLYGEDGDGATDGSHASDLGFMRQADAFEPVLRRAMGRKPAPK